MDSRIEQNSFLARKFYLFSVGLYGAVVSILGFSYLLQSTFGLNVYASVFISYFVTVSGRSLYNQLVIYELRFTQISFKNNFILVFIGTWLFFLFYYFIREPLGEWSLLVAIPISMRFINEIKGVFIS